MAPAAVDAVNTWYRIHVANGKGAWHWVRIILRPTAPCADADLAHEPAVQDFVSRTTRPNF
jgi:hypothetical protein